QTTNRRGPVAIIGADMDQTVAMKYDYGNLKRSNRGSTQQMPEASQSQRAYIPGEMHGMDTEDLLK
ncbi:hypothetical protein F2P79_004512, partial [Pimephales promelas]